jgi:selenide,water dikinase
MSVLRLTTLSHGAGCACKVPAALLAPLVAALPVSSDPNLLVGMQTSDDAGIYRLRDDLALVQTVDFFTPIVDDPYDFGRIAATNALSDVYAMGGRPVSALNLVAWSVAELGSELLGEVLRGGADVAQDAGVAIVGGHTIDDPEPKYGMAVTGVVEPDEALAAAVEVMTTLNEEAAAAARAAGAHAMTDVTGFGLLGHLHELALASGLAAEVDASAVPAIPGALELLHDDRAVAGGSANNRRYAEEFASFDPSVDEVRRRLVTDAMTSGGLLVAVDPGRAGEVPGVVVGRLVDGEAGAIRVR